jgi:hypothetical protein
MKIEKVKKFCGPDKEPKKSVSNNYNTRIDDLVHPLLMLNIGVRNTGKSYLCATMLNQFMADKIYCRVYVICPTWVSNKCYYEQYVNEVDVFEPMKGAILSVEEQVKMDCEDWEDFLTALIEYEKIKKEGMKWEDGERLFYLYKLGILDEDANLQRPTWKYEIERPPQSLVILDDVLGSRAIGQELTRLSTLSRHVAPINIDHKLNQGRTAGGLSVIINSQTYRMTGGLGRCLRENITVLNTFENKSPKMLKIMCDELCACISEDDFYKAYEKAIQKKYECLSVDFFPKQEKYRFRKCMRELIILEDDVKNENEILQKAKAIK